MPREKRKFGDPLTKRQREVVACINKLTAKNGYPPSVRELGEALKINSPNAVMDHIKWLEKKGAVHRSGDGKSRTLKVTNNERCPTCGRTNE